MDCKWSLAASSRFAIRYSLFASSRLGDRGEIGAKANRKGTRISDVQSRREDLQMKYAIAMSATLLFGVSQIGSMAHAQSPEELVKQAMVAQGGADALRAFKTAVIKGEAKHWEPGQSYAAGGEPKFLGDSTFTMTADGTNRTVRIDWDRDMKYPAVERIKFSEIIAPGYGVVTNDRGSLPMSGIRLASHQRELGRADAGPIAARVGKPRQPERGRGPEARRAIVPAVGYTAGGTRYIILFDRTSKLPAAVRTRDDDHIYGDSELRHRCWPTGRTWAASRSRIRCRSSSTAWRCSG